MFARTALKTELRAMLTLAVPLAGAQLAQAATGFIDTMMMGWLGSETIAAGGLAAVTFNFLVMVASGLVSAVSPLAAEAFGSGQTTAVRRTLHQGLWLAGLLGLLVVGITWNLDRLMPWLGQPPETVAIAATYWRAIAWGCLPAIGFAALRSFVSALSQPRPVIVVVLIGTGLNIFGNYSLMVGRWGLPAMGLAGIGLSSALSFASMFGMLGVYLLCQRGFAPYRLLHRWYQFDRQTFSELVRVGLPIGGLLVVEAGLFTLTTLIMGQLGTVALAAHQIALQTAATTFMVPLGISLATTIRVGQLRGQGNPHAARLAGYTGITLGGTFMAMMGLLFWLAPASIVGLYLDVNDPANQAVVDLAQGLLGVAAVFQIVDGVQVTAAGALRGLKDTRIPLLIGLVAYWGVGLVSGYLLSQPLGLGGVGLWWGLALGLLVAAVILSWRFAQLLSGQRLQEVGG